MRLSGVIADTSLSHVPKSCETSMECSFHTCQPWFSDHIQDTPTWPQSTPPPNRTRTRPDRSRSRLDQPAQC